MTAELIPAKLGHALALAHDLDPELLTIARRRDADQRRVIAKMFAESRYAKALRVDGTVVAVYGVVETTLSPETKLWMLVSRSIGKHRKAFLAACHAEYRAIRATGRKIVAYTEADYRPGVRFLQHWGFEIGAPVNGACRGTLEAEGTPGLVRPRARQRNGTPFIVLSAGRSGSAALSRLLSYGNYDCGHEQMRYLRGLEDAQAWLSQDFTGTAETCAAPWWRLMLRLRPDIRVLIVRRPVHDIVDSWLRLDMRGVCTWRPDILARAAERTNRYLDRIAARVPAALTVQFADLGDEETGRRIFEHCLPYEFDQDWWARWAAENYQEDQPSLVRYYFHHREQMVGAATEVRKRMRRLLGARPTIPEPDADGVVIQREYRETFWRDAQDLMTEHCIAVGEPADQFLRKNLPLLNRLDDIGAGQIITARLNGRMLGYLISVVSPSLEAEDLLMATQLPFYVSPDAQNLRLVMRLQRAAIADAEARGVEEIYGRAGVRGDGPRLGIVYRRLGFDEFGQLYKLTLKKAA